MKKYRIISLIYKFEHDYFVLFVIIYLFYYYYYYYIIMNITELQQFVIQFR